MDPSEDATQDRDTVPVPAGWVLRLRVCTRRRYGVWCRVKGVGCRAQVVGFRVLGPSEDASQDRDTAPVPAGLMLGV